MKSERGFVCVDQYSKSMTFGKTPKRSVKPISSLRNYNGYPTGTDLRRIEKLESDLRTGRMRRGLTTRDGQGPSR